MDELPPTPRKTSDDIEKGNSKMKPFEMADPPKQARRGKYLGRNRRQDRGF